MNRDRSLELMRPKIRLIHFLLFHYPRGYTGSISELGRQLGYADDSYANRMLHELMEKGFIAENNTLKGIRYKLTPYGILKVMPFVLPNIFAIPAILLAILDVVWGIGGLLFAAPPSATLLTIVGAISISFTLLFVGAKNLASKDL